MSAVPNSRDAALNANLMPSPGWVSRVHSQMPVVKLSMLRVAIALVVSVSFAAGCRRGDGPAREDAGALRSQLDSVWLGLTQAMRAGDTAAVAAFYTDDAFFAETGQPTLRGRAAIRDATARVFACCRYLDSQFQPDVTELAGERALQFGTYRDLIQPSGQPPLAAHGRVGAVFQRGASRAWQISGLIVLRDSLVPVPPKP